MKKFIAFIRRESPEFSGTLVALTLFSGLVNGLSVSVAIQTAKRLRPGELHMREFFLFSICLFAFWITKEYVLNRTNRILEGIVRNVRVRIIDAIKTTNLAVFERIDRGRVTNTLSTDAIALSYAAGSIINASSSAFMLVFVLVSIGILSMWALAITLIMVGTAVYLYMQKSHTLSRELGETTRLENAFFHNVDGVMSGYKQLKLNRKKSDDFFGTEIWNVINETAALRIKTGKTMNQSALLSQTFMLFTIAGILFLLPNLRPGDVPVIAPVLAILLFATGPISDVVMAIPALARAEASISNIESLENDLRQQRSELEALVERQPIQTEPFESIACVGTAFAYAPIPGNGPHGFQLQPFDFSLKAGEIVFIVGGNGSGKSTFLKVLTGLYEPAIGQLLWNDKPVSADRLASYRNLFTPIFTDFFLFRRLIGLTQADEAHLREQLSTMELAGKVDVANGELTTTTLSTGQRKRLALALAETEHRPVFIFDEWAADQDPVFRRFFYTELLPAMKARGQTVVAVTHDDAYFAQADRVLKMDYGRFLEGEHHVKAFEGSPKKRRS